MPASRSRPGSSGRRLDHARPRPFATVSAGKPSGSTNPLVDDHIISALAMIVVAVFAARGPGYLGSRWAASDLVTQRPWLR